MYLVEITNKNIGGGIVRKIIKISRNPFRCNEAKLFAYDIGRYAWACFGFTLEDRQDLEEYKKFVSMLITGEKNSSILNAYSHVAEIVVASITDMDKYMEKVFPIIEKADFVLAEDLKKAITDKDSGFWKGNFFLVGKWCILGGQLWLQQVSNFNNYPEVTSGWDGVLSYGDSKSMAIFNAYTRLNENGNKVDFGVDEENIDASLFKVMQQINSKAVKPIKIKDIVESKKK